MSLATEELTTVFKMHTVGSSTFTRRHAINIADWFNVTPKQIVAQLETAKLIPEGSWGWFATNGGITIDQTALILAAIEQIDRPTAVTNNLCQGFGRQAEPSSSRASRYMTRRTAFPGRWRSKISGLSQRTAIVLSTRRCLIASSSENLPANCNRKERNSVLFSSATVAASRVTQTGAHIHPQSSRSTHSVSDDTVSIALFLPESIPSPIEGSSFPAALPTKVLSSLIRGGFINERAKKTDLLTKGDDNHLCEGIVENKHVRFIGNSGGHDLLRASARDLLSPSSRDVCDPGKIGHKSNKSIPAPIEHVVGRQTLMRHGLRSLRRWSASRCSEPHAYGHSYSPSFRFATPCADTHTRCRLSLKVMRSPSHGRCVACFLHSLPRFQHFTSLGGELEKRLHFSIPQPTEAVVTLDRASAVETAASHPAPTQGGAP